MTAPVSDAGRHNGDARAGRAPTHDEQVELGRARLAAELDWIRALLADEVERFRDGRRRTPDAFLGFTIDDAEVDRLLGEPLDAADPDTDRVVSPAVRAARERADRAAGALAAQGLVDGLDRVAGRFGLGPHERMVLLFAAAPDLDERFETLCAYVHDDIGRRRPSVGLALRLLGRSLGDRWSACSCVAPDGPLARHGLVRADGDGPRLSRPLVVDDRVVDELLGGSPALAVQLAGWVMLTRPEPAGRPLSEGLAPIVERWHVGGGLLRADGSSLVRPGAVLLLDGRGAADAAAAVAATIGPIALEVRLERLRAADVDVHEAVVALAREAALRQAPIVVADAEELLVRAEHDARAEAVRAETRGLIGAATTPVVLVCAGEWPGGVVLDGVELERRTVPVDGFEGRASRWHEGLAQHGLVAPAEDVTAVAAMFGLAPGEIDRAVARMARAAGPSGTVDRVALHDAARSQVVHGLGHIARHVEASAGWADLVVAPATGRQLRELATVVRVRHVLDGADTVALRSRGLSFLFAGPSGTGKSLTASVLAAELGLDLYAIDLATVVSKYIGETEKQLRKVFDAARSSNAVLFFDEADALFGKRSEVSDADDRYANIEVAYLLQQMESYDGVAILATNLSDNIDDAFARRMHQIVEFALPDAALRKQLWTLLLRGAPIDDGVDVAQLAARFELSGGNIRNAVVHARLLAAGSDRPIGLDEIVVAVAREYQKLGKHPTQNEFGDRFGHILELLGGA